MDISRQKGHPRLIWESGAAFDLFVSLHVLHNPERFGLRRSWAAGVRSRLSPEDRNVIGEAQSFLPTPLQWLHALPEPKDGQTALWELGRIPPAERLSALGLTFETPPQAAELLAEVSLRGSWSHKEQELLLSTSLAKGSHSRTRAITTALNWWSRATEFGEHYLAALRAYYQVFFEEEERQIYPDLLRAVEQGKGMAAHMGTTELLEELSRGVRFTSLEEIKELVLAPSYWSTPLVVYAKLSRESMAILFGARPTGVSLVHGEAVPEQLIRSLKALADPTRLRILRYLAGGPLTPAQLSRRLRLRAPTVVHHLNTMRSAGIVHVTLEPGGERRYSVYKEALPKMLADLDKFMANSLAIGQK